MEPTRGDAFGYPGMPPRWTRSSKEGVGTAYSTASRVWFTLSHGILNEVYFPTVDSPQVRDLGYLVTDGESLFHEEKRDLETRLEYIDDHALGYRLVNTDPAQRYRIVKEIIADPHLPCVLVRTRLEGDEALLEKLRLYVLLAPHLEGRGWGNSALRLSVAGRDMLTASRGEIHLALGASIPFSRSSCGFVGASDGWTDLKQDLRTRYSPDLPPELRNNGASLDQIIEAVGAIRRQRFPAEPYKVLASLPLPVYITTNWNNLLSAALKEAGKDPQIVLCPWNDYVEELQADFDPGFKPTPERPLVYHLFGKLSDPESVVLTEDDYFDYLIGVTRNKDLIPSVVRSALVNSALLFLGFQLDDWQFRVLFRSIRAQQGGELLGRYPHIGVQLEPEEGRIPEPVRARKYLESYFSTGANISLYWGRAEDFVKELQSRLLARPA